ncbi:MAG: J domain-containing protein [Parvibaculum sp.]|nr:J domain-containing protein [Parvibaculum sp.]MCW5728459.1 J domain-containing protein [Parvibaculum sp.]
MRRLRRGRPRRPRPSSTGSTTPPTLNQFVSRRRLFFRFHLGGETGAVRDPYEILGLARDAGNAEVKAAYRRLAKRLHPDAQSEGNAGRQQARFQEVTAAYNQLKDEAARRRFEAERRAAAGAARAPVFEETMRRGAAEPAPSEDIFSELFEGIRSAGKRVFRARGNDRGYRLSVSFLEAANGVRKRVRLDGGKTLEVNVPAGIDEGQQIRLRGQGDAGHGGADAGDALVTVAVEPHPRFRREGHDIHLTLPVSLPEAVLGARIDAPTVSGPVSLTIPAGANAGTRLRLKGRGIAVEGGAPGDQYVTLEIVLPEATDEALRDFAATWTAGAKHNPRKDFSDS